MKTIITVTNEQLTLINYPYEIIDEGKHTTTINIEYNYHADLFYLGCTIGIQTLAKAYSSGSVHKPVVLTQDKGHTPVNQAEVHQGTQGDIETNYSC